MQDMLKAIVNSLRFWESMHSKNKLAGRSFFQNLGSQGPGRVSPSGSARAAPWTFFAACSEASGGFNCVSKVLLNSQCKKNHYGIWKGKSKPHLGKVCIFLPTLLLQKSQKHNVVMKVLINTIGKKIHTLVKKNTPCCHKIRQECGFTQKGLIFLCIIYFSSPLSCKYWQAGQTHTS